MSVFVYNTVSNIGLSQLIEVYEGVSSVTIETGDTLPPGEAKNLTISMPRVCTKCCMGVDYGDGSPPLYLRYIWSGANRLVTLCHTFKARF